MPFDLQGARAAGYSDGEIAAFLGQQAGFDTDAAVKSGYTPGEIIPFLSDRMAASEKQLDLSDAPQPMGDASGAGDFAATVQAASTAAPQTGAGRGFVNPPMASQPQPKPVVDRSRHVATQVPAVDATGNPTGEMQSVDTVYDPDEIGAVESFGRGWGQAGAQMGKTLTAVPAAPIVAAEAVTNVLTGNQGDTKWQDWYFQKFLDPMQSAVDWYRADPGTKQSVLAKVSQSLGAMTQDLPQMIASGGLSSETTLAKVPGMAEFIEQAVSRGFDAMRPVMVKAGTEKAQEVLDAGGTPAQAANSALTAALITGFQGAQPMSASGNVIKRAVTGFPVGVAQGEAARVVQNAADPEALQRPFSPEEALVEGVTGAAASAAMGHSEPRMPTRDELGYGGSDVSEPEARPLDAVLNAGSVDEAIAAAQKAANPEPAGNIRAQMLAIRPLEIPDVRRNPEVPAEAAGADRSGLPEPTGGVADRVGGDAQPLDAVAEGPAADRAEGGPVPSGGDADAVKGEAAPLGELTAITNPSGTVTIRGTDTEAIIRLLRDNGITSTVRSADGVLVGRSQAEAAQRVVADFQHPENIDSGPGQLATAQFGADRTQSGQAVSPPVAASMPEFRRGTFGLRQEGMSRESFRSEVGKAFGEKTARALEQNGVIVPLADQSKLPAHVVPYVREGDIVYGFHDPRTASTYAVLSNLTPDMVRGLVIHEVGVHYGFRNMLGVKKYDQVMERIKILGRGGDESTRKEIQTALNRARKNSVNESQVREETLAYLVQNHPELPLVRDVIAKIKAFLFNKFGLLGDKLTVDDITALARAAVKHSARGKEQQPDFVRPADFMVAYHGSPHDFDAFSTDHIGTGEGNQAYGHGLYFAGQKEVAEHYRRALSGPQHDYVFGGKRAERLDGKPADTPEKYAAQKIDFHGSAQKAWESVSPVLPTGMHAVDAGAELIRRSAQEPGFMERVPAQRGRLYHVDIPEEGEYLLWDKPLSEQPPKVREALAVEQRLYRDSQGERGAYISPHATGETIYRELASGAKQELAGGPGAALSAHPDRFKVESQRAASQRLRELGIRGIKYLDGQSRNKSFKDIKREFQSELPEDADFDQVTDLIGTGTFSPANEAILKALKDNDWLGFDYPAQAISAALSGKLHDFDASPELVKAIADAQEGGTHNYVLFNDADAKIVAKFSREQTANEPEELPGELRATPGARAFGKAREFYDAVKREVLMATAPMSAGSSTEARAVAQRFANETRLAQQRWQYLHDFIGKNFTAEERERMWDAADAENVERTRARDEPGYERPAGVGLESLSPKEREAVETLHDYADALWNQAKAEGMIDGEGLPFWTPRMVVTVGEDGDVGKLRAQAAGPRVVTEAGHNLKTTASSLKQRKYLTTEETEAAASALAQKQGEAGAKVVRDIMTMPLAMNRLERAIAGRRLVNQIKDIGRATGEDLIREDGRDPNYVMISHPALMTYSPKFVESEGKIVPAHDQNGDVIFDGKPLFIRKDFEGPLRAVLSTKDGAIYSGYMLLKSKAMTAIMFSPLIHNMVIWGKALPYSPLKMFTLSLYAKGHAIQGDMKVMEQALRDGVVPLGANRSNMVDITDIAQPIEKMGKWGDPNESWVSLSAQKLGNALHDGWGGNTKKGLDAAGEFLHHTLLWKQVGALQMGIYADARDHYIRKGFDPEAAGVIAAHLANRYAGVVAKENQSEIARKTANVLLFSRSFNFTNWGTIKDAFTGMPTGLRSLIEQRAGKSEADRSAWAMRRKAWAVLALDLGFGLIAASLVQDWVNMAKKDKTLDETARGYVDRLASMFQNIKERPGELESYNPWQLSSTYANEPGKKTRIDMGEGPTGRHEYMRLPTGKVIEDLMGWVFHAGDTAWNKMAPLPKAAWESIVTGKDSMGVPVTDPNGSMLKRIGEATAHVVKAQVPWDTMKGLYDLTQGYATDLDKKKFAGNVTGFTFSQGHPNGPEGAVNQLTQDRFEASRRYTMQQVKDDLKHGDVDAAVDRMQAIGMTNREINAAIQRVESPRMGLSKKARQNFERRANDAERREMESQQSR